MREPAFTTTNATVYQGHALDVLREMPDESVDLCVTSPPFYGLRAYQTDPQIWAADDAESTAYYFQQCEHEWGDRRTGRVTGPGVRPPDNKATGGSGSIDSPSERFTCQKCSAWKGELGQEPTPGLFIQHLVTIFHEVKRVLKPHGTLWLEVGDTYNAYNGNRGDSRSLDGARDRARVRPELPRGAGLTVADLKPKDLIGIPWMLAFALRADGWWLRSDIAWVRTSAMPESVRDRPTNAWSHIFLFAKNEHYYFDAEAVRETGKEWSGRAGTFASDGGVSRHIIPGQSAAEHRSERKDRVPAGRNIRSAREFGDESPMRQDGRTWDERKAGGAPDRHGLAGSAAMGDTGYATPSGGRNLRSVWTLGPDPLTLDSDYGGHYASYPRELVRRCVLAGSSAYGVCSASGMPYERDVEKEATGRVRQRATGGLGTAIRREPQGLAPVGGQFQEGVVYRTVGWKPTCGAPYERVIERGNSEHHHRAGCGHVPLGDDDFYQAGSYGGSTPTARDTGEWKATCQHGGGELPDDLEIIETPTGDRAGDDPTFVTGRAGMNRPRGDNEGRRPMTRYEQRKYAEQIRGSEHRVVMEVEVGSAFAHYIRTDRSGARPVPPGILDLWIERGWLTRVEPLVATGAAVEPATILDPFLGSGTTCMVAVSLGRRAIGIELNSAYIKLAQRRIAEGEMERSRAGGMDEPLRAEAVSDLGPLWEVRE